MGRLKKIIDGLHQINLGFVNAFVIDHGDLTLIDTGVPGSENKIIEALHEINKDAGDIRQIIITHAHLDHCGSLAALKKETEAKVFMHAIDAALFEKGLAKRPEFKAGPGIINQLMFNLMIKNLPFQVSPVEVDQKLSGSDIVKIGHDALHVYHAPGHSAGQCVFYWKQRHLLFAADAASNVMILNPSPGYEDWQTGKRSLQKISEIPFEIAVFGHGKPILNNASARFKRRFT